MVGMAPSESERIRFGHFSGFPPGASLERLERARFVDVNDEVELIREQRIKVMALPLRPRDVEHPDGALQGRAGERLRERRLTERQQEPQKFGLLGDPLR